MSQSSEQLLSVRDLKKHFPIGGGLFQRYKAQLKAVDGVSFTLQRGETLGLVGESGCGKTTAGRVILRLLEPTSGSVTLTTSLQDHEPRQEHDIFSLKKETLRLLRRQIQIVFHLSMPGIGQPESFGSIELLRCAEGMVLQNCLRPTPGWPVRLPVAAERLRQGLSERTMRAPHGFTALDY